MENIELDRFIYLLVLGLGIAGWFVAENRQSLGKTARQGVAWFLIFVGIVAAYGLWQDVESDILNRQAVFEDTQRIEVPRRRDGHFEMTLQINGTPINVLVDTGASEFVLSPQDARRVGIDVDKIIFAGTARTANGTVRTAYTSVDDVRIGALDFGSVPVSVNEAEMSMSLLGMSFLDQFERIEIAGDQLILER
ncbi:MAG: TIGR02281 family clan AA aspartic protease [Boseongicola sp.]|nr:TIGR02281 family clan AA aspartic protease [Boseongicola sp.]